MSKLVYILRWIAVLPAAVVCSFLVAFPIHWFVMFIHLSGNNTDIITIDGKSLLASIPPEILERFGYALFVPFTLIYIGSIIAPRFKFQTSIVIAVLIAMLLTTSVCCISLGYIKDGMSVFRWLITIALWIIGISCGLYYSYKKSLE
jgi:phosphoglycerol transferase MdoB-like AlkP superfamily enzyme